MKTVRNICMRNCYDTCALLAQVENDRLIKVSGDFRQSYTLGTLCGKGYSYVDYVYHPNRVLYPLRQTRRGSGNWQRISWDEALEEIAGQILKLYRKSGSFLPLAFHGGTGNKGVLAQAMFYMLSSLGPLTRIEGLGSEGDIRDAQLMDFGGRIAADPELLEKADLVILWGVNPASTAIHQARILQKLRRQGSKVVLIDVYHSGTARMADDYIRVRPGGDGALALAVLRDLICKNRVDYRYIIQETEGWEALRDWLLECDPGELSAACGVTQARISSLANQICTSKAAAFWIGNGLLRYENSVQNIRGIHALAAAGGILSQTGAGFYAPYDWHDSLAGIWGVKNLNLNRKAYLQSPLSGLNTLDPALKMLWITQGNPLVQGPDLQELALWLDKLDLIVTTDHFLTTTADWSDIVLPAATIFETEDIAAGKWHQWIGFNEQAIQPRGEVRSELEIAQALTRVLNDLQPGICPFPAERTAEEWLKLAFGQVRENIGITDFEQLKDGPQKLMGLPKSVGDDQILKYRFQVPEAAELGYPEIPSLLSARPAPIGYPCRLISVHRMDQLNSQLDNLEWISEGQMAAYVLISEELARRKGINSGSDVMIYNELGEIILKAKVCRGLPADLLIVSARKDLNGRAVNTLSGTRTPENPLKSNIAYHDTFVNIVAT